MKIILIFLAGVVIGFWFGKNRGDKTTTTPEPLLGKGGEEKRQRKEKIMELFARRAEIKNDDVQTLLGVSDASATNYLSELEREGKIDQVGTVGRFVSYRRR